MSQQVKHRESDSVPMNGNTSLNMVQGSLLGGAIGDALGAPIEFLSLESIQESFGPNGLEDFAPAYGRIGAITDDTQMTLFTAEGLLRAFVRARTRGICNVSSVVMRAYRRWLETQEKSFNERDTSAPGWLYHIEPLWSQRAPGTTCISALRAPRSGDDQAVDNDRKGAGGIMRIGPVAMMYAGIDDAADDVFELAMQCARMTHGHPSGYLAAGAFAVILHALLCRKSLGHGITLATEYLITSNGGDESLSAMQLAQKLAQDGVEAKAALARIGEAWVAEEALGVSIYCALTAPDFSSGVLSAVNHDGDSDTTGLLVGQLLGAQFGLGGIPSYWIDAVELKDEILKIAQDLTEHHQWEDDEGMVEYSKVRQYPGM